MSSPESFTSPPSSLAIGRHDIAVGAANTMKSDASSGPRSPPTKYASVHTAAGKTTSFTAPMTVTSFQSSRSERNDSTPPSTRKPRGVHMLLKYSIGFRMTYGSCRPENRTISASTPPMRIGFLIVFRSTLPIRIFPPRFSS